MFHFGTACGNLHFLCKIRTKYMLKGLSQKNPVSGIILLDLRVKQDYAHVDAFLGPRKKRKVSIVYPFFFIYLRNILDLN